MRTGERVTLQEAAAALGVSEQTARRWVKSGKLKAYRPGLRYLIPASAIEELLEDEAPKVEAPPSPDRPEEGDAGAAALAAWSEYLDALLRRVEELRGMFLALGDLDDLDPEDAEHRIDMTFAVALEFAANVGRITSAQGPMTRLEGEHLTLGERQQLSSIFRQSNELLRRRSGIVAFVEAVRSLAEDMAIKKAVKDLLEDAGIPDWDAVPKDV